MKTQQTHVNTTQCNKARFTGCF